MRRKNAQIVISRNRGNFQCFKDFDNRKLVRVTEITDTQKDKLATQAKVAFANYFERYNLRDDADGIDNV